MKDLSQIGQGIIDQADLFNQFLNRLTALEVADKEFSDELFERATLQMPLYAAKLKNLKSNLDNIRASGQKVTYLFDKAG